MDARSLGPAALVLLALASPAFGGEGLVALVTCEASCPSDEGTYAACGNGTVTDNRTGLVWLANANCFGPLSWHEAMEVVAGLGDLDCGSMPPDLCDCGLGDNSSPGEWRLPSMNEWVSMTQTLADIDACQPSILKDSGTGCWYDGCFEGGACSFYGVESALYWSSSSYVSNREHAWLADLDQSFIGADYKSGEAYVWPVRGGQ